MANLIFVVALLVYLVFAAGYLFRRSTHGRGFSMFVLLYPVFLIAFLFVTSRVVVFVWLGLALTNMVFQFFFAKSTGEKVGFSGILVGSLFLWPIQFAAAVNSSQTENETNESKTVNREKLGELPATIEGTVTFTHHHGTEEGHDSVWLEEFGELDFMTDARTFDRIGIAEGKVVSLKIDERDAFGDPEQGKVLWIIDGQSDDPKS